MPECYVSQPEGDFLHMEPQHSTKCTDYNDTCFVHIVGDKVFRGCFNDYARHKQLSDNFLADNAKSVLFKRCADYKCNGDVVKQADCIKCDSNDDPNCHNPGASMVQTCAVSVDSTACYHHSDADRVIRGCMSEVRPEHRQSCANNSDQCKVCAGNGCNNRSHFQRCKSCDADDDCESEICHEYVDECFIHVQRRQHLRRGCLKSAPANVRKSCDSSQDETCEKCSDRDDCNDRRVDTETCLVCDSVNVDECFLKPNDTMVATCPLGLKPLGCFLLMKEAHKAERGCVISLHRDDRAQCRRGRDKCKTCMGNNCNAKRQFQSCISCDPSKNVECENDERLKTVADITCPDYLGTCYSQVGGDKQVRRGCVGDTIVPTQEACNGSDCEMCDHQSRCNDHKLFRSTCHKCDSQRQNCTGLAPMDTEVCKLTLNAKGCFHRIEYVDKRVMERRGCLSSLSTAERNACGEHSNSCKTCKSNKCNRQRGFSRCIECSSDSARNCIWAPSHNEPAICPAYDDKCFTYIGEQHIGRGCVKKQDAKFKEKCRANPAKCNVCDPNGGDGAVCNGSGINLTTCYACDSRDNALCRDRPHEMRREICNVIDGKARQECFLSIEGERYRRGCMSHLAEPKQTECRRNTDTCKMCVTKNCNDRLEFHECVMCNSNDDPQCVSNAMSSNTGICEQYSSICIVGIDDYGVTHRRCSHDYMSDVRHFTKGIDHCEKNNCNNKLFPIDRKQCFQCTGDEDCDYPSDAEMIKPCAVVSPFDRCYTYRNKSENFRMFFFELCVLFSITKMLIISIIAKAENKIFRGCITDSSDSRILCGDYPESCVECKLNGCNSQPKDQPAQLKCHQCSGPGDCAFGQNAGLEQPCKMKVPFLTVESCFTLASKDSDVVRRGCTLDVNDDDCNETGGCKKCHGVACNNENVKYHQCVVCNSGDNNDCAKLEDATELKVQCTGDPYPMDKRGCYTVKMGKYNVFERLRSLGWKQMIRS